MPESPPAAEYPPVLTTAQAAGLLQVHPESLRKMVREGRVPVHRFPEGRALRFLKDELLAWLASQPAQDQSGSTKRVPSGSA